MSSLDVLGPVQPDPRPQLDRDLYSHAKTQADLMMNVSSKGIPDRYGPIRQLAFAPRDFDAAIRSWTSIGVGPFFSLEHLPLEDVIYKGRPIAYDTSVAIAFWGDLEIEILRQHNAGPSILNDWTEQGREGVHHVRIDVDDLQIARAHFEELGGEVIQSARLPEGGEYIMMQVPGSVPTLELSILAPRFARLWAFMKRAAQEWDGFDPVRAIPPEAEWRA